MIDYERIGQRIHEQRKHIFHISQEKMAEDLLMYQADISNIEKAKSGSGITDLVKLEIIADYFGMPLENLLFGKGYSGMEKYQGKKMQISPFKGKQNEKHLEKIKKFIGFPGSPPVRAYKCGDYALYAITEYQFGWAPNVPGIKRDHYYVFFDNEAIAVMSFYISTVMEHVFIPRLKQLQELIPSDVLDVTDVQRTLNPYWVLWWFSQEETPEKEQYLIQSSTRADQLRSLGEEQPVLYVDSVYVDADCRQKGVCRMLFDLMKLEHGDSIIWLNMEPAEASSLMDEYDPMPVFSVSEVGQISLNAAIAEKLGFTVDPDVWHRQAEVIGPDGEVRTEVIEIRKCAYYLPQPYRKLISEDHELVAYGRALQKIRTKEKSEEQKDVSIVDLRIKDVDGFRVQEWKNTVTSGPEIGKSITVYAAKSLSKKEVFRFGVSKKSIISHGIDHEGQLEQYEFLDDAVDSEYFDQMFSMWRLLLSSFSEDKEESDEL